MIIGRTNALSLDLDRSNVSNAYVSGMKEELHMYGTEYNVSNSFHPILYEWRLDSRVTENQYDLYMWIHRRDDSEYAPSLLIQSCA